MNILYPSFLALLLFAWTHPVAAQEQFMFKTIETSDGLSHGQVNAIYQDSRGFIWFSTAGGLNRYDGYEFKIYTHKESDVYSIADNFTEEVQEDADGNLWVTTASGYSFYDVRKELFINDIATLAGSYGVPGNINLLYIDKEKNLWFHIADKGVFQYNRQSADLITYPQGDPEGLSMGQITCIRETGSEMIFLFNSGLIETISKDSGKLTGWYDYIRQHDSRLYEKYSMFIDSDGDLWVHSKGASGVWLYDVKADQWSHLMNVAGSRPYRLSSNVIQCITDDDQGRIWLATDHGGIDIIDKSTGTFQNLQHDVFDGRSIPQNSINSLYRDRMDVIWVGTYKKGVSRYSASLFKFELDYLNDFRLSGNFDSDITYIENGKANDLWLGTNGSGLIHLNRVTGERKLYRSNPAAPSSLSSDVIVSLCNTKDGKLWIGTYLGGMDCFDGTRFIHYGHKPGNPNSLASANIWSIAEDDEGMIWIGTLGGGLQRLNPATGEFVTYSGGEFLSSDYISSLHIGKNDNIIYIGTAFGITLYHKNTGLFEQIQGNKAGNQSFSNHNVHQVYQDSRNLLWIASRDGLSIYNRKDDSVAILRKSDGLADDFICSVVEDDNKNMWITTTNGVTNIVVNTNSRTGQSTYTCYNYDELDGLQGRDFNMRSIAKNTAGEIIMGGINGYNVFNPDNMKYNETLPRVVFTDFRLFNREIEVDSVYNGNKILTSSLPYTDRIELEYKQNVFSIGFSGMNYILPEKARFLYKLEGFNTDWLSADGYTHRATYTSLPPGKYVLRVKASNSDGFWNDETAGLTILIRPPFWLSGWAYLIYFLLILGALWLARYSIFRNERAKFRMKEVELEAERKHELDDMKLRFFTNISHELRTPLALIISPLDNLLKEARDGEYKDKLVLMRRNALKLLNMVNQLLDFRKNDVQGHKLNLSSGDIVPVLRNICQSFAELSGKKSLRFTFTSAVDELVMDFDEDKINKIMMNLLSNAFKFTPDGGSVEVQVNIIPATGDSLRQLQVKVLDTGGGVKDEDKQRIFERFYQVQDTASQVSGGSGIGLHLVKEFITLHQGAIYVQDNEGQGSVFIYTIPAVLSNKQDAAPTKPRVTVLQEPVTVEAREDAEPVAPNAQVILFVDDNDDFRSFMKFSLEKDYVIKEAVNGRQAWEMIPDLQPDMVISDVMMPEVDGIELARLIKNDVRTSHIPLILLTARTAEEHKVKGLETGADDYLTKPFNFDILSLRIRKLLELREMKQEKFNKQIEPVPSEITITSLDEKLIARAIKYIEDNMSRSELSVEELSRELGMSRVHLYKKLMIITGKSPVEFIRVIRLKRAAQFLRKSQMNISEIAYEVGFNNPKYFSRYFREEFGMLPSEYKAKTENNQ